MSNRPVGMQSSEAEAGHCPLRDLRDATSRARLPASFSRSSTLESPVMRGGASSSPSFDRPGLDRRVSLRSVGPRVGSRRLAQPRDFPEPGPEGVRISWSVRTPCVRSASPLSGHGQVQGLRTSLCSVASRGRAASSLSDPRLCVLVRSGRSVGVRAALPEARVLGFRPAPGRLRRDRSARQRCSGEPRAAVSTCPGSRRQRSPRSGGGRRKGGR